MIKPVIKADLGKDRGPRTHHPRTKRHIKGAPFSSILQHEEIKYDYPHTIAGLAAITIFKVW